MGESGDIFFPKLDEERDMIPFDKIALALLEELGMEPDLCASEEEAKEKALRLGEGAKGRIGDEEKERGGETEKGRNGEKIKYPIYFFGSDTSGEKSFEEFFTENELLDNDSFINLGVIKNSVKRDISEIDAIFNQLETLFSSDNVTKAAIVEILKGYLPNFAHIETGKGLDQKM